MAFERRTFSHPEQGIRFAFAFFQSDKKMLCAMKIIFTDDGKSEEEVFNFEVKGEKNFGGEDWVGGSRKLMWLLPSKKSFLSFCFAVE